MLQPTAAAAHELQARLFAALNERMRRAGVETAERAPLMTLFMTALHGPRGAEAWLGAQDDPVRLAQALLDLLDETEVPEVKAFADYMRLRLVNGPTPTTGARALHAVIGQDIPQLCADRGWTVTACYAALQAEAFKLVDLYEAFQTHVGGNDLGQYFTPRHIVRAMAWMVEIIRGRPLGAPDRIYDPAAGVAGFLVAALERVQREQGLDAVPDLLGGETTTSVAHMARMNLWMASGRRTCGTVFHGSSLERDHLPQRGEVGQHTLAHALPPPHPMTPVLVQGRHPTVVLMNPPFPEDKKAYQSFEFVEHALRTLEEGGTLAALIPAVLVIGEDRLHADFRARMLAHAQLQAVITMPPTLFAPGASINTYVVILRKQAGGHRLEEAVFFARTPTDGFDMDRALHRRAGPRQEEDARQRGWVPALGMGGDMARLFQAPGQAWGSGWLFEHSQASGPVHHQDRQASSVCLPAVDGSDWAPERFIEDHPEPATLLALANHIACQATCEEVRRHFRRTQPGTLAIAPITPSLLVTVQQRLTGGHGLGHWLTVRRAAAASAKGWAEQGPIAVISASEQDNGVCGYTAVGEGAPAPGLSVAKNGRPGVARVQTLPYAVTGDVAALAPRHPDWSVPELCVLAALIEAQSWRFSYGRKASERRLLALNLG